MANSTNEISYFKIGTFVLIGIGLIIFALLIFGSRKMLEPVVYVETYFEESVQGISEGTPVKYRGLQIGYVENITFASEIYKKAQLSDHMHARSIYVKIAITSKLFTKLSGEKLREFLADEVAQGLRVKLVTQGLTGTSHLEFNYVDPKTNPIPKLEWTPHVFYVPSVTSTLTMLSENAQYIINELKDIDFKKLFADINILTESLNRTTNKTENLLDKVDSPLIRIIQELKIITGNLGEVSSRIKLRPSELIFSSPPPRLDPGRL